MRLREFAENDTLLEYILTEEEQQARFKFLNAAAAKLKGAADQAVTVVKNAADAMRLLYQVVKDPKVLLQAITLLRQALSQLLAKAHDSLVKFIEKVLPKTNNLADFFKILLIYGGVAGLDKLMPQALTLEFAGNVIVKQLFNRFLSLDSIVDRIISSGGAGIMDAVDALKLAHDMFFDVLSRIAKRLSSVILSKSGGVINLAKVVEAQSRKTSGWFLINSLHEPIRPVTDGNFTEMSAFYASPKAGDGYLGFIDSKGNITHYLMTNHANQIGTVPGKPW